MARITSNTHKYNYHNVVYSRWHGDNIEPENADSEQPAYSDSYVVSRPDGTY